MALLLPLFVPQACSMHLQQARQPEGLANETTPPRVTVVADGETVEAPRPIDTKGLVLLVVAPLLLLILPFATILLMLRLLKRWRSRDAAAPPPAVPAQPPQSA